MGVGCIGKLWGYEYLGVELDIFISVKGLVGGVFIGVMMCKKFCDVFELGNYVSIFGGNFLVCVVGLVVLKIIEGDCLLDNV